MSAFKTKSWTGKSPWLMLALAVVLLVLGVLSAEKLLPLDVHGLSEGAVRTQWRRMGSIMGGAVAVLLMWSLVNFAMKGTFNKWLAQHRGKQFWVAMHFLLAFAIGMFAPSLWMVGLSWMVAWEIFECYTFDWSARTAIHCNGWSDIAINTAGTLAGLGASFGYNGNLL